METKQLQDNSPQASISSPDYLTPPDSQDERVKIKARRKLQKHDEPTSRPVPKSPGKDNAVVDVVYVD